MDELGTDELSAYVIWVPRLGGTPDHVPEASTIIINDRTQHYWDEEEDLGTAYGNFLELGIEGHLVGAQPGREPRDGGVVAGETIPEGDGLEQLRGRRMRDDDPGDHARNGTVDRHDILHPGDRRCRLHRLSHGPCTPGGGT